MRKPQFSLKTLLFVVTLAAVLMGSWIDHQKLTDQNRLLAKQNNQLKRRITINELIAERRNSALRIRRIRERRDENSATHDEDTTQ